MTDEPVAAAARPPTRRPRDRREQILAAAAEQFRASGYHNVGVTEIADSVGITGPALYRHFRGKQDLLLATIRSAIDEIADSLEGVTSLDEALLVLGSRSIERRAIGVLWQREVVHLPDDTQAELRARSVHAVEPMRAAIAQARPDLGASEHDLLLWAALAVLASPGYHAVVLDPDRFQTLLIEAAGTLFTTYQPPPANRPTIAATHGTGTLLPTTRGEAVLTVATRLFAQHGYQSVGMDDIGAAAGITGASVYYHFAGKAAILEAVLTRCLEALMFDLSRAFDVTGDPGEALDQILQGFVRVSIQRGTVIGALLDEIVSLPEEAQESIRQTRRTYVAEWAGLLVRHRPELTDAEARVLVHAATAVVSALLRVRRVARRPTLELDLVAIGRAVLGLPRRTA